MAQASTKNEDQGEGPVGSPGRQAVEGIATLPASVKPTDEAARDALAWIMAAVQEDPETADRPIECTVNLGTETVPDKRKWVMRLLEADEIETASTASRPNRAMRRAAGTNAADNTQFYLRLVAMATIEPDLTAIAEKLGTQFVDPTDSRVEVLRASVLKRRPGVIDYLATQLLIEAGYSDDAVVVNGTVAKAAGN